jgi:RNA polymerase sigma-70 factor (sigma-E family)
MTDQNLGISGRPAEADPFSGMADVGAPIPDAQAMGAGTGNQAAAFVEDAGPVTIRAVSQPTVSNNLVSSSTVSNNTVPINTVPSSTVSPSSGGVVATDVDVTADLLTETYQTHYSSLLRLAALLLDDLSSCEDVVQEAFIRVHTARARVREPEKLLAYLRQTVVNLSRSTLRRRLIGLKLLPKPMPDAASAEEGAYDALERDALILALRGLQRRQREVLVLRYFADLTEAQVAAALGVSIGSVKAYGSRGIEALRARMEEHR